MAGFYLSESFQILGIAVYVSIVSLFVLGSLKAIRDQAALSKDELRSEIQSLRASNDSLRQAQRLLQEKFRQAAQRPPEVSSVGLFDQDKGQAEKLLKLGVNSEQLVNEFGFTETEAGLIDLLHNSQAASSRVGTPGVR